MSLVRRTAVVAALALACTTVGVGLIPSAEGAGNTSKTYRVQGVQERVGNSNDLYTVKSDKGRPGLVGDWVTTMTAYHVSPPWYFEIGTEKFDGCLDRSGDQSCKDDPAGSISFTYAAWVKFDPITKALLAGGCVHPVTAGTGAFQGVRGLLTMRDTPRADGSILTTYRGTVTLSGRAGAASQPDSTLPESSPAPAAANAADAAAPVHPRGC
ncbi:MAG TPA: hypothetical protein VES60_12080 [Nakamurella sp.]|nr:hypothetical protein [Nakamurella sp.]